MLDVLTAARNKEKDIAIMVTQRRFSFVVVAPDFRRSIDCRQQPAPAVDRPPPTQTKMEALVMLLEHCRWHPRLTTDLNLDSDDIEAVAKALVYLKN